MLLKFNRNKERSWLLTIIYRAAKLFFFINHRLKMEMFLNLEWIFERLAIEESEKIYTIQNHPKNKSFLEFISKIVNAQSIILDVGFRFGDLSYLLSQIAQKVIAIDINKEYVKIASDKYAKNNLIFIYAEAFAYLNGCTDKFNVIILSHIIEHLDNPVDFLVIAKKHTDYIFIEVPDFDKNYLNRYRYDVNCKLIYSDNDHIWEFDRTSLKDLIDNAHLKIEYEEYKYGMSRMICKV